MLFFIFILDIAADAADTRNPKQALTPLHLNTLL